MQITKFTEIADAESSDSPFSNTLYVIVGGGALVVIILVVVIVGAVLCYMKKKDDRMEMEDMVDLD